MRLTREVGGLDAELPDSRCYMRLSPASLT
jgi:hypothetical protein